MESTAENMMKVLYQEKCTTIVMLSNQFEGDQVSRKLVSEYTN